jgi:hypothetical protein
MPPYVRILLGGTQPLTEILNNNTYYDTGRRPFSLNFSLAKVINIL